MSLFSLLTYRFKMISRFPPLERISAARIVGYTLQTTWVLSVFYSTFIYTSGENARTELYFNQYISLSVLIISTLICAFVIKRVDKAVLSRRMLIPATIALAVGTVLTVTADLENQWRLPLGLIGACATGATSGILALSWIRLFTDAGALTAAVEIPLSWLNASIICMILNFLPTFVAVFIVTVLTLGSGCFIRWCAFNRPARPIPEQQQHSSVQTKKTFVRGGIAALAFGFVAGFSDVISGFRMFVVNDSYGIILISGAAGFSLLTLIVVLLQPTKALVYLNRIFFLGITIGCLLISFMSDYLTWPNLIVFGAYVGFTIIVLIIAIDISNYYDISVVKVAGIALTALFLGELLGYSLGHLFSWIQPLHEPLGITAFLLCSVLLCVNLFLFSERDLTIMRAGLLFMALELPVSFKDGGSGSAEVFEWLERLCRKTAKDYGLSTRESEVLPLLLRGRTIVRIQNELHISPGTVNTHIRHIYNKLGVNNRQEMLDLIEIDSQRNHEEH